VYGLNAFEIIVILIIYLLIILILYLQYAEFKAKWRARSLEKELKELKDSRAKDENAHGKEHSC
jgi:predicted Holliday junction resolvase-like endonuclease